MRRVITLLCTLLLLLPATAAAQTTSAAPRPTTLAGRSTVYAPNGVIATSQPLASAAGLAVLQNGGNAFDAAVAAAAVLGIVEPHMTGIGGDMFALVWSAQDQRLYGLNASGRSGAGMTRAELLRRERSGISGIEAVTVPGAVSGWTALLDRFGSRNLAELLEPAIRIAEDGFPVSPIIARQWGNLVDKLKRDPGAAAAYLIGGERAPSAGEWFSNPDYAAALRGIAQNGAAHLYGGELGARIVAHVQELGGFLTLDDLRRHEPFWVDPISVPFRGYRLWELPPNNQGIAALEMLRLVEDRDLEAMGHNSAAYLHVLIEAKKLAYADLNRYVADPAHLDIDPLRLLGDDYIRARRALIDDARAAERVEPGDALTATETIYLSVADAEGNMVSFINSVFDYFGSGVVVPGTGFVLQDRGSGFTLQEGMPNTVAPGKLPFHTLVPAFVTKTTRAAGASSQSAGEEPWLAFGVMGGAMQPQGHVQVLLNLLVFGMDLQQAVDAPRFRHLSGLRVAIEAPVGAAVRSALTALGHDLADERRTDFGGAQAVMRLPRGWAAASDPRKDGLAIGH
jgi:gamma-glutamyltranspeptidase/glutathione hydrolase